MGGPAPRYEEKGGASDIKSQSARRKWRGNRHDFMLCLL
jgi:hypothetical protein